LHQLQSIQSEDYAQVTFFRMLREKVLPPRKDQQALQSRDIMLNNLKYWRSSDLLTKNAGAPRFVEVSKNYKNALINTVNDALRNEVQAQDLLQTLGEQEHSINPLGLASPLAYAAYRTTRLEALLRTWNSKEAIDQHLNRLLEDPLHKLATPLAMPAEY